MIQMLEILLLIVLLTQFQMDDATDTATLIITVTGVNDAPVAVNDTDSVNEDATVTRTSGSSLLMADDSDADDDDSFTVTQIAVTGGSNSSVAGSRYLQQ